MDEIEVKIKISNPDDIRKKLNELNAENHGSVFEKNIMFDTNDRKLSNEDKLLRLRDANGFLFTYKGPADKTHEFKKRMEINLGVDDTKELIEMFSGLGYFPTHRYEKKRETWKLGSTEILIDEVPRMGFFIEIEGQTEDIKKTINLLGLNNNEPITKTYHKLWTDFQKSRGMKIDDNMVFKDGL